MKIKESTTSRSLPWDADNTAPGGPTSLDILLTWLTAPGKYKRLHSEKRSQAVHNILCSLQKNGIEHRSDGSVRCKVRSIENQYLTAKAWLEERNIDGDDVVNGEVDRATEEKVRALCPHYCDVMPVFRHSSYLNEMVPIHESAAGFDPDPEDATNVDNMSKSAKQKRKRGKQGQHLNKQRPRTEAAVEVVNEKASEGHPREPSALNSVRQSTTHGVMQHGVLDLTTDRDWIQRTDKCEIVVRESGVRFSPGIQRDVDQVQLNHVKKHSEAVLQGEEKMREAVFKDEEKMREADFEAKQSRNQVQLQLEKVMARQTMKKGGVPDELIERAMPLQQLEKD